MISTETFYWICRARVFVPLEQELGQNEIAIHVFRVRNNVVTEYLPDVDCPIQKHGFIIAGRFLSFEPKLTMSFHFSILFLISRLSVAGCGWLCRVVGCCGVYNTTKPPFPTYRFVAKQSGCVDDLFHNIVISTKSFLRCFTARKENGWNTGIAL